MTFTLLAASIPVFSSQKTPHPSTSQFKKYHLNPYHKIHDNQCTWRETHRKIRSKQIPIQIPPATNTKAGSLLQGPSGAAFRLGPPACGRRLRAEYWEGGDPIPWNCRRNPNVQWEKHTYKN